MLGKIRTRQVALVASAVVPFSIVMILGLSGNSGSGPSAQTDARETLIASLEGRPGIDARTAACVADYVFKTFSPSQITALRYSKESLSPELASAIGDTLVRCARRTLP